MLNGPIFKILQKGEKDIYQIMKSDFSYIHEKKNMEIHISTELSHPCKLYVGQTIMLHLMSHDDLSQQCYTCDGL